MFRGGVSSEGRVGAPDTDQAAQCAYVVRAMKESAGIPAMVRSFDLADGKVVTVFDLEHAHHVHIEDSESSSETTEEGEEDVDLTEPLEFLVWPATDGAPYGWSTDDESLAGLNDPLESNQRNYSVRDDGRVEVEHHTQWFAGVPNWRSAWLDEKAQVLSWHGPFVFADGEIVGRGEGDVLCAGRNQHGLIVLIQTGEASAALIYATEDGPQEQGVDIPAREDGVRADRFEVSPDGSFMIAWNTPRPVSEKAEEGIKILHNTVVWRASIGGGWSVEREYPDEPTIELEINSKGDGTHYTGTFYFGNTVLTSGEREGEATLKLEIPRYIYIDNGAVATETMELQMEASGFSEYMDQDHEPEYAWFPFIGPVMIRPGYREIYKSVMVEEDWRVEFSNGHREIVFLDFTGQVVNVGFYGSYDSFTLSRLHRDLRAPVQDPRVGQFFWSLGTNLRTMNSSMALQEKMDGTARFHELYGGARSNVWEVETDYEPPRISHGIGSDTLFDAFQFLKPYDRDDVKHVIAFEAWGLLRYLLDPNHRRASPTTLADEPAFEFCAQRGRKGDRAIALTDVRVGDDEYVHFVRHEDRNGAEVPVRGDLAPPGGGFRFLADEDRKIRVV